MTPEVARAIAEIGATFPENQVQHTEDGQGGAYVRVLDLTLGEGFMNGTGWLGAHLTHLYPATDVYPQYTRPDLKRPGDRDLGVALAPNVNWNGQPAMQISRKSKCWDPNVDTAATKFQQVLAWLRST
ncbi:MAG: hypothetical protein ABI488_05790 [Polyangiaceae bacterium]